MKESYMILAVCTALVATSYSAETFARRNVTGVEQEPRIQESAVQTEQLDEMALSQRPVWFCSPRSMIGTYQYREEGYWEGEPYRSSGLETYDGRGNIVGMATDSDTGESYRFTGTYDIDGDCSGRVMYTGGFHYDVYISPDGSSVEFISTDLGTVLSGPSRRISTRAIVR
ncbi:hypothetical protein [Thiocapsa sp.]|uniref:hypothetical protein n=1 Tax=Thiocapsa sp. TaxID=2024551 RepID=UPI0025D4C827|nr:hypothetical protein [Thiocapsa sp.]